LRLSAIGQNFINVLHRAGSVALITAARNPAIGRHN
jgi:hypothetical protein